MLTAVLKLRVRQLHKAVLVVVLVALANLNGLLQQSPGVLFQLIVVLCRDSGLDVFSVRESCLDCLVFFRNSAHSVPV